MDAIDVVSHINEILNTNVSDNEKVNMIKDEINEYFDELIDEEE